MACLRVVKSHHCYDYKDPIGEEFKCLREPENQHGEYAISLYSKIITHIMEIIGHIPDALAEVAHRMMSEWKVPR